MRSETPERVFFTANFSEIEPVGRDVPELAEFSLIHHGLQAFHARVVLEQMAHHQDAVFFGGQSHQLVRFVQVEAQGEVVGVVRRVELSTVMVERLPSWRAVDVAAGVGPVEGSAHTPAGATVGVVAHG